jgi:integrase
MLHGSRWRPRAKSALSQEARRWDHPNIKRYNGRYNVERLPTGSLVITVGKDGQPHWEGKFRWQGKQIKRRLGLAWLSCDGGATGSWQKRPGRPQEGFLSERDAYAALTALITAHAAQEAQGGTSGCPTFLDAANAWYERAQRRGRKPATLLAYRWVINAHIRGERTFTSTAIRRPCPFADKPVDKLSKHDMREWFDGIPNSPQKVNVFKIVKSICKYAVDEGWMAENVARHVDCRTTHDSDGYDYYDAAEVKALIEQARDDYDAALFATAAYTGMRKGEIFALQWRDIDFERSRITVKRNYSGREIVTPKNGSSRVVPLIPQLVELLKEHRQSQHVGGEHVFPGSSDAAMDRYRKAVKNAGLRHLPFHSLRHAFGSHAVQVATLVQVRDWLGHSDLRMTARYLHAKSLDSDADLLAAAF